MEIPPVKSNIDTSNDASESDSLFRYSNSGYLCYISTGGVVFLVFQCFTSFSRIPRIE